MALIVHKYGGTSVGSPERIRNVARRVAKWHAAGHQMMWSRRPCRGETNRLIALAREIAPDPDPRELDVIAATGEQVTIGLLGWRCSRSGLQARSYTGRRSRSDRQRLYQGAHHGHRRQGDPRRPRCKGYVVVVAGFQGMDAEGNITTLGRGGSDTSAVALAAALKADECLIYTDVDGVYTTDPRIEPTARRLQTVTFEEMLEMASLGSKVLQIRSVEFAGKYKVPLRVLSSLTDPAIPLEIEARSGTLITFEEDQKMEQAIISGIAFNRDEAKITVAGVPDRPGVAYQILGPIGDANIDVDMIIQNASVGGQTDFSFTVHRNEYAKALEVLNAKVKESIRATDIRGDEKVCKVSMVGVGMRTHAGIASQMFRTLSEEGINIQMISTSEIKISVVIDDKYMELAVRALHKAFGLEQAA